MTHRDAIAAYTYSSIMLSRRHCKAKFQKRFVCHIFNSHCTVSLPSICFFSFLFILLHSVRRFFTQRLSNILFIIRNFGDSFSCFPLYLPLAILKRTPDPFGTEYRKEQRKIELVHGTINDIHQRIRQQLCNRLLQFF